MNLVYPKLPMAVAPRLKECPVESVAPFALMITPMYVFMPKNERFVSVKAPLDFFTPKELDRLKSVGKFYVPDYIDQVVPYRSAGRSIRALLGMTFESPDVGLTPFELSDAIIRLVGSLWRERLTIDPFFITVLVNELFDSFPEEVLNAARDEDVDKFERSLYQSSWAVFLALHLGYNDLTELKNLRDYVFELSSKNLAINKISSEWDELIKLAQESLVSSKIKCLRADYFKTSTDTVCRRLESRMKRVENQIMIKNAEFIPFAELLKDELKVKEEVKLDEPNTKAA